MSDGIGVGVQVTTNREVSSLTETNFPAVPKRLLERLERLFPNECPQLDDPEREIWFRAGQHAVVRVLRAEHERQAADAQS